MKSLEPASRKSGLLEVSIGEPKGALAILLKAAKKEEKLILSNVRKALKKIKRANNMIKSYKMDIFGESYGVKRVRKFKKLINDALQLTMSVKIYTPLIETIAKEVKDWLLSHKKDTADLLPADEKIIEEVRRTKGVLETAVKNLTELDNMQWGSASAEFSLFGMYYVPVYNV
jgi:tRNA threonylcarbamoyladenosine modification (KEOPS) complex Cgi121 subunit